MKKLIPLLLALLFSPAPAAHAFKDILYSPVQVIDFLEAGRHYNDYSEKQKLRTVGALATIAYDHYLKRPWGKYLPEANARWKELRAEYCPRVATLCSLPPVFGNERDFLMALYSLNHTQGLGGLEQEVAPYHIDSVSLIDAAAPKGQFPYFQLLLSGERKTTSYTSSAIWGMEKSGLRVSEMEYVLVWDLASYAAGFGQDPSNSYVVLGREGAVLNVDAIKSRAMFFAKVWRRAVDHSRENFDPDAKQPGFQFAEEYMLTKAFRRYESRFLARHAELTAKLATLPAERVGDVAERFAFERARGDYPEEVYQFVAYDLFREMLSLQARYFLLAKDFRKGLNFKRQTWESLLTLQSEFDPQLVALFTSLEGPFPRGLILNQFANPNVVPAYFYEFHKAILGIKEYAGRDAYARFKHLLSAPELWDADFLKEEAPEVLAALRGREFASLDETEQKRLLNLYLHDSEGKIRFRAFFRANLALQLYMGQEDGRELARYVHEVRAKEFSR